MADSTTGSDEATTENPPYALHIANVLPFWAVMVAVVQYLLRRWGPG